MTDWLAPWHWTQRCIDLQVLWPEIKKQAAENGWPLERAQLAFSHHAFRDPAWRCLGEDEVKRRIDRLR